MKTLALGGLGLGLLVTLAVAQGRPALPKAPRGFDDGRAKLIQDAAEGGIRADALMERLFEYSDLTELALFAASHLRGDDRAKLDTQLDLKGALSRARDAAAIEAAFTAAKLNARAVAKALGKTLEDQEFTTAEAVAWLYARGSNFRTLQDALDGSRMDSLRRRADLRRMVAQGKPNDQVFEFGHWQFNLADGRDEKGGHYKGDQLMESLLALGWTAETFQTALGRPLRDGMSERQRALLEWGDPVLFASAMEHTAAESEVAKAAMDYLKRLERAGTKDPRVLEIALLRARCVDRWFRTAGPGVEGVWTGPLPAADGAPKPPRAGALELADAGWEEFADGLGDAIKTHFGHKGDTLTMVAYADGSARMLINRPGRAAIPYGPDTPPGAAATIQMYEGRFSLRGKVGFATLVFGEGRNIAPTEVELVNVTPIAGGALISADLDDGHTLTPILLRRTTRLVTAP